MKLFDSKKDEDTFSIAFKLYTISIMRVAIILKSSIQIFIQCSFIACMHTYLLLFYTLQQILQLFWYEITFDRQRENWEYVISILWLSNKFLWWSCYYAYMRLCLNEHAFVCVCVHCFVNSFSIHIIKSRYTKVGL